MSQRLLNAPTNRIISALTATAFVYQPLMSVLGRHIYILFLIQLASSDIEAASLEKRLRLFTYPPLHPQYIVCICGRRWIVVLRTGSVICVEASTSALSCPEFAPADLHSEHTLAMGLRRTAPPIGS
jgi:hypothetical protein